MRKTILIKFSPLLVLLMVITALFFIMPSCGGGGGESPVTSNTLNVSIWDDKLPNYPNYFVVSPTVDLEGDASCDKCPGTWEGCRAPEWIESAMNMKWINLTSGATGTVDHGIVGECFCGPFDCWTTYFHTWGALKIPLNVGENDIKVIVTNASGGLGSASITITRFLETPINLMATSGAGQIILRWDSVLDAASYNLYWSTSINFTKETATKIENVSSPYAHSGLSNDVTYYYYVTAVTGSYESSISSTVFATAGWQTEDLVSLPNEVLFAKPSIAIGPSGNIHIFYVRYGETNPYNDERCYGYYLTDATGSGFWTTYGGFYASLDSVNIAVDQTDTAHISFTDYYKIVYGTYSSVLDPPVVPVDSHKSYMSSLDIDSMDKPHISYCSEYAEWDYGFTNVRYYHDLRYAIKTGGTWTSSVVYTFPEVPSEYHRCGGEGLSFALDKNGVAHIVFSDIATYPSLQYATNQGGAWTISALNTNFEIKVIETIVVDTNGKVHMVFLGGDYKPRYAHNIAGDWTVDVFNETSIYNLSLSLDEAGKAHISYASDNPPRLKYATNASGAWNIALIDTVPSAEEARNGIALDPEGKVHIVYYYGTGSNSGDHILKHATNK